MSNNNEFDLLADLAKLVKKYGPDTFISLANQISNPEFTEHLAMLLSRTAITAQKMRDSSKKERISTSSRSNFRSSLNELEKSEPEKADVLSQLYDGLVDKTFLPSLREMRNFIEDNGLLPLKTTSREKAIIPFVKLFLPMPIEDILSYLQKLQPSSDYNDRSLEGWSNIIFNKADIPKHSNREK